MVSISLLLALTSNTTRYRSKCVTWLTIEKKYYGTGWSVLPVCRCLVAKVKNLASWRLQRDFNGLAGCRIPVRMTAKGRLEPFAPRGRGRSIAGCFADAKDAPIPDPRTNGQWSYSPTRPQPSAAEWNRAGRRMMGDKRTATNLAIPGARLRSVAVRVL
jgi:hypothetical protein